MDKLIVANWKMNGDLQKLSEDLDRYLNLNIDDNNIVVLGLPYTLLSNAYSMLQGGRISIASQDVSRFPNFGAYTGEISASMLRASGVRYVIVGHSERREYFGEGDDILLQKCINITNSGLIPIFCVGESKQCRDNGNYKQFICDQLSILSRVNSFLDEVVIAYEPIWSIGTGCIPNDYQINEICKYIYDFARNNLKCGKITVLYGGSVSSQNAHSILAIDHVGGVLIGGASLKVDEFAAICAIK